MLPSPAWEALFGVEDNATKRVFQNSEVELSILLHAVWNVFEKPQFHQRNPAIFWIPMNLLDFQPGWVRGRAQPVALERA
jgi:hypothetical protein